jgi:cobalamin biosynthesis Mg chelatase CobN
MNNEPINEERPIRWSLFRIVAAVSVLVIVLGGIVYGIYSLTQSSSNVEQVPLNSNHLVFPKPSTSKAKTKGTNSSTTSSGKTATTTSTNNTNTSQQNASGSTAAASSGQLSNTGPGNSIFIGFVAAFVIGAFLHYGWRKRHHVY